MEDLLIFLFGVFLGVSCTILIFFSCSDDSSDNSPTAIDVYQGKTTLQYVVVDSVVVDSCVIWKNKEEEL